MATQQEISIRDRIHLSRGLESFDFRDIVLLDGFFKPRYAVNREYLMSLDVDALLYSYRDEAVLPHWSYPLDSIKLEEMSLTDSSHFLPNDPTLARAMSTRPYDGWEHPTFTHRGHFLGHYLSACAALYALTKDPRIKNRGDYIVEELAKCQEHSGNGYVGPIPEKYLDILERGTRFDLDRDLVLKKGLVYLVFIVPYYVLHKIMMGLMDTYKIVGNMQALHVLTGMVGYIQRRVERISEKHMQRILDVEFGGMSELLYVLYNETGDKDHLELARRFEHKRILTPLAKNQDCLANVHGNATIPKIHGAACAYEVTGIDEYRQVAVNFWNIVSRTRTYATGGSTVEEYWKEADELENTLSSKANQETCTSNNWFHLTEYLLKWTADARYGDMCERVLFNSILSIQNPADGMFAYYTPLRPSGRKGGPFLDGKFGTPTDSFWCCYGSSVQMFASLPGSIYFHNDDDVYVNLFIPSQIRWSRQGKVVRIIQENNYPIDAATRFTIKTLNGPVHFGLNVRIPWWVRKGVRIRINGQDDEREWAPGTFLRITRDWYDGDTLEVAMPMGLYAESINDNPDVIAILYGPLVLAGLTSEGIELEGNKEKLDEWIRPVPNEPLAFQTVGQRVNMKFVPLYQIVSQEYGVYFHVNPSGKK